LFAWIIYRTVGSATTSELEKNGLYWIFYLAPPVYLILSGLISQLAIIVAVILVIVKKSPASFGFGATAISINVVYIYLYIYKINLDTVSLLKVEFDF
jgi:hypothetical protein